MDNHWTTPSRPTYSPAYWRTVGAVGASLSAESDAGLARKGPYAVPRVSPSAYSSHRINRRIDLMRHRDRTAYEMAKSHLSPISTSQALFSTMLEPPKRTHAPIPARSYPVRLSGVMNRRIPSGYGYEYGHEEGDVIDYYYQSRKPRVYIPGPNATVQPYITQRLLRRERRKNNPDALRRLFKGPTQAPAWQPPATDMGTRRQVLVNYHTSAPHEEPRPRSERPRARPRVEVESAEEDRAPAEETRVEFTLPKPRKSSSSPKPRDTTPPPQWDAPEEPEETTVSVPSPREPSPEPKEPTPEPVKEQTPEPVKEPTPEPVKPASPRPKRSALKKSARPVQEEKPKKEPTPEPPPREPTPEPAKEPTPEPVKEPTPEPVKESTPEPVKEPTPEPVKEPTPEPVKEPTPEPVKEPTPEPEPEPVQEPEPVSEAEPEAHVEDGEEEARPALGAEEVEEEVLTRSAEEPIVEEPVTPQLPSAEEVDFVVEEEERHPVDKSEEDAVEEERADNADDAWPSIRGTEEGSSAAEGTMDAAPEEGDKEVVILVDKAPDDEDTVFEDQETGSREGAACSCESLLEAARRRRTELAALLEEHEKIVREIERSQSRELADGRAKISGELGT